MEIEGSREIVRMRSANIKRQVGMQQLLVDRLTLTVLGQVGHCMMQQQNAT